MSARGAETHATALPRAERALRMFCLLLAGASHFVWLASLDAVFGTSELARRDWSAFRAAGALVLDGRASELYLPRPGGFPFLHPPVVAILAAPFSRFGDVAFYAGTIGLAAAGLVLSALALHRIARARVDTPTLLALASAPWIVALILGQPIALALAAWLGGLALLVRRPALAGATWGLCALKPTLLPALVLFALVHDRRALGSLLAVAASVLALGLVLGGDVSLAWLAAMAREAAPAAESWKQHTLYALLRATLPNPLASTLWALAALGLGGWTLRSVARGSAGLRELGSLALATIALSPYAYDYDALVLVIPCAALALERERYARAAWWTTVTIAGLTGVAQYASFVFLQRGPPFTGAFAAAWLIAELATSPPRRRAFPRRVTDPLPP
ncbi:MAG: glycosyltransferase 87 family protein [Sandaracinaceae bacterium]